MKARAVEDRLMQETWARADYDLLPAVPGAQLVTLSDCGHFAHLECPEDARAAVEAFLDRTPTAR